MIIKDSFFSFFDRSSVAVFPCTKACNQGSIGLLQGNQHGIIKAVVALRRRAGRPGGARRAPPARGLVEVFDVSGIRASEIL